MHYARCKAGKKSIRTACNRVIRYANPEWTTAANPVTCEDCKQTHWYRERRAARGLDVNGEDAPLPRFHPRIELGARARQPKLYTPEFIEYLGPLYDRER